MACATLKRSLDLDSLSPRPVKRRRCAPFGTTPKILPTREPALSPFANSKLSSEAITNNIREEMRRLYRRKQLHFGSLDGVPSTITPISPNSENQNPSTPPGNRTSALTTSTLTSLRGGSLGSTTAASTVVKTALEVSKDKPLFTFRQVTFICERMMRERETELRELYEQALATKLAEQYDTFVKFTHDQLQKRFENSGAPSYLS